VSVTANGSTRLEPFARPGPFDPIAAMIGTGTVTGDATGGIMTLRWDLDRDFAYIMRGISGTGFAAADFPMRIAFQTGIIIDAIEETYTETFEGFNVGGVQGVQMKPPPMLILPQIGPDVFVLAVNTDTIVVTGAFRALIFERAVLTQISPSAIAEWLA